MIAVVQRVKKAGVAVEGKKIASIGKGFLIFIGIEKGDSEADCLFLADKIVNLRIMADEKSKMNKSILDVEGEMLVVSQFTLCADTKLGRRPSFINAMEPENAKKLYSYFINNLKRKNLCVQSGIFGAFMDVSLVNDGPVTFILKSNRNK